MAISVGTVKYVLYGSSEDTGQYLTYIIHNIHKKYNIKYNGKNGYIEIRLDLYISTVNKQVIQQDNITWVMSCGSVHSANICQTNNDLLSLYNLVNSNNTDGITLPDDFNKDLNIDTVLESLGIISDTDNKSRSSDNNVNNSAADITDKNRNSNTDSVDGNYQNSNKPNTNVINNTLGSSTLGADRSSLPRGADPKKDTVTAGISDITESNSPNIGNNLMNKGTVYPIIRINDHYFQDTEIQYFSMETGIRKSYYDYVVYKQPVTGFLPTMTLIVTTSNKSMLKQNIIKNGDRCAVFFTSGHLTIKSMRCDFRITNVITNEMNLNTIDRYITLTIYGELYVPNLRNEKVRYNFNGSARDGMMDAAKRLKLSFFFCDPEDTQDIMVWCCCKTPQDFIMDMTTHAWKNDIAFFESWIDPRYGLSFQNINRLLGEEGLDEEIDLTIFQKAFMNHRGIDGTNAEYTEELTKTTDRPMPKILTNIADDSDNVTPYHINNWRLYNNALAILDFVGLNCKIQVDSTNPGMDDNSKYSVETSLCINRTKVSPTGFNEDGKPNAFYVLTGPGKNNTYENADEYMGVSETENSNSIAPEVVAQPMSDGDNINLLSTGGNMLSSGNTHKFYEVAYEHNMRNLLLLLKQYIICELNGANLSIVRGEKIPVILIDHDKVNAYVQSGNAVLVSDVLYESESGWYIIDGIEWIFDPANKSTLGTAWSTKVKLTKREWPIPGINDSKDNNTYKNNDVVLVDVGNGNTKKMAYMDARKYGADKILGPIDEDSIYGGMLDEIVVTAPGKTNNTDNTSSVETQGDLDTVDLQILKEDIVEGSDVPLTGMKDYMKQLYKDIYTESDNRVKLVAARRWAVDENGTKVDGNAFLVNHGYYKCVNAKGDIMYFKRNNSKHFYGEAFDIINTNGLGFTELMTNVIMKSSNILTSMYNNGISAYIELALDDNGVVTKHYHFGTDTTKQKEFWNSVKAVNNKSTIIPGTYIDFSSYQSKNKVSVEINNNIVTEHLETDLTELS